MLGVQQAEPAIMEEEEEEDALEGAFSMMLDEENVRPHRSPSNVGEDGSGKRVMGGRDDEDTNEVHEGQAVEANEDTLRAEAVRCAEEFGASSEEAVAAQMQLAMLLIGLMNWAVANEVLRSLLQRAEGGLGLAHELSLQALGTHAGVQWQLEQWEDARDSLTRLVGAREKSLSEAEAAWKNRAEGAAAQLQDAQELAAEASAELASVHVEFGEHEKAVPRYQGALAMQKAAFGELSAPVLGTLDALAASLAEVEPPIGGSELAEQALRSALPLKQALGGKTSQAVADCHNELSVLLQGRGEFELAEEEARRALHVYRQLFGELHVFTATAVNNLALLLQAQGALPQAEVEVRKALRVFQNVLGQAHDDSVAAMRSLVEILWEQEKIEEAAEGLTTQLSLQAQLPDTDYRWMAQGCAGLGSLQWQLENLDEAYRSLDAASQYYELQTKAMREEDEEDEEDEEGEREADRCSVISEHAAALNSMACVLQQLGHEQEALVPLSRSVAIYGGALTTYHLTTYSLTTYYPFLGPWPCTRRCSAPTTPSSASGCITSGWCTGASATTRRRRPASRRLAAFASSRSASSTWTSSPPSPRSASSTARSTETWAPTARLAHRRQRSRPASTSAPSRACRSRRRKSYRCRRLYDLTRLLPASSPCPSPSLAPSQLPTSRAGRVPKAAQATAKRLGVVQDGRRNRGQQALLPGATCEAAPLVAEEGSGAAAAAWHAAWRHRRFLLQEGQPVLLHARAFLLQDGRRTSHDRAAAVLLQGGCRVLLAHTVSVLFSRGRQRP
jgi:tetratricopeptide (TPR) repeat protein